jgi:hypothetical protein
VGAAALAAGNSMASAYMAWLLKADKATNVLVERASACRQIRCGDRGLSLLSASLQGQDEGEGPQVCYVQWAVPGVSGRIADLDEHDRVKCIVPVGGKRMPKDFSNAEVIHPGIDVSAERTRGRNGQDRPQVPEDIVLLSQMWKTALRSPGDLQSVFLGPCSLCKEEEQPEVACFLCAVCQMHWHDACASHVARHLAVGLGSRSSSSSSSRWQCPLVSSIGLPTRVDGFSLPSVFSEFGRSRQGWGGVCCLH